MSEVCKTVKIQPEHPSQGEFVEINETDFDPAIHTAYGEAPDSGELAAQKADLSAQIVARGGEKPHHATGVAKLQEILAALPAQ